MFDKELESSRFDPYRSYEKPIREEFEQRLPALKENVDYERVRQDAEKAQIDYENLKPWWKIRRFRSWCIDAAMAVVFCVALMIAIFSDRSAFYWGVVIVGFGLLGRLSAPASEDEEKRRQLEAEMAATGRRFDERAAAAIEEAYIGVVNAVVGPEGKVEFPTTAPRLVEIGAATIVQSHSLTVLQEFIAGHDSSAIGIAGPRGSGKSTLLRKLENDEVLLPHCVAMTAPVHYDATDFIRRLYREVALMITGLPDSRSRRRGRIRRPVRTQAQRLLVGAAVLFAGLVLIATEKVGMTAQFTADLRGLGWTGVFLAFLGFLMTSYACFSYRRLARPAPAGSADTLADYALDQTSFTSERVRRSKNTLDLFSKMFTIEDEDSWTRKDRELSQTDLVKNLRELLLAFVRPAEKDIINPARRIAIIIDELDKISNTDDLIDTVNSLKDLFHIEGVHFVVSVSTDALRSFEQRGLTSRDAFDSSFDTIIGVEMLTWKEADDILESRAVGFPPSLRLFCYAWSGGLPRDLLRTARQCVEIQRGRTSDRSLAGLVQSVIAGDLTAVIEGEFRRKVWPPLSADDAAALFALRTRAIALREGIPAPTAAAPATEVPSPGSRITALACQVHLGEHVAHAFMTLGSDVWSTPGREMRTAFTAAAEARALGGDAAPLRDAAFEVARVKLDELSTSGAR
ncbi:P-loop NTPase fold protein [Nocardia sp. NPDC058518]|uniref:P-loop NTPase fold protein n=1 Tax=Nocardia sp. NPDC058518 TaxID=3346534 RepID=UPI003667EB32